MERQPAQTDIKADTLLFAPRFSPDGRVKLNFGMRGRYFDQLPPGRVCRTLDEFHHALLSEDNDEPVTVNLSGKPLETSRIQMFETKPGETPTANLAGETAVEVPEFFIPEQCLRATTLSGLNVVFDWENPYFSAVFTGAEAAGLLFHLEEIQDQKMTISRTDYKRAKDQTFEIAEQAILSLRMSQKPPFAVCLISPGENPRITITVNKAGL